MAQRNPERPVQLSVLDRLLDNEPANRQEAPLTRAQSVRELKAALRRDLEWLLNTRRCIQQPDAPESGSLELTESVYAFGVADFTSMSLDSGKDRQRLTRMLEETVATFEPRLQGVRVVPQTTEKHRALRFVIEGMLQIEPSPELVSFDTTIEPGSGEFRVKGE
jgi:type VI secretion system protein ImpF